MRRVLADQEDYGMSVDELIWLTVEYRARVAGDCERKNKNEMVFADGP